MRCLRFGTSDISIKKRSTSARCVRLPAKDSKADISSLLGAMDTRDCSISRLNFLKSTAKIVCTERERETETERDRERERERERERTNRGNNIIRRRPKRQQCRDVKRT
jgi:hypothetical protein